MESKLKSISQRNKMLSINLDWESEKYLIDIISADFDRLSL